MDFGVTAMLLRFLHYLSSSHTGPPTTPTRTQSFQATCLYKADAGGQFEIFDSRGRHAMFDRPLD